MEKVNANMIRSIFFGKSKKPSILSLQSLQQDIFDFDEIMQDQRHSNISIISEPGQKDTGAQRKASMGSVLVEHVQDMESSTRNSYDRAFEIMQEFDDPAQKMPDDIVGMAKESVRTMQKVTYMQYLLNTGHARLHVALKMAHLLSDGVRTLYRQQG